MPQIGIFGLSYKAGEGRAIAVLASETLRPHSRIGNDTEKLCMMRKRSSSLLAPLNIMPRGITGDAMLYAFLLSADPGGCTPEALAERFLDRKLNAAAEQQAEATLAVSSLLAPQLAKQELVSVYRDIDLPLAPVLARMELTGIRVETCCAGRNVHSPLGADRSASLRKFTPLRVIHLTSTLRSNWARFCSKR